MAKTKNNLVPIDFSKCSRAAFNPAIGLAQKLRVKLLLVHVITALPMMVPLQFRAQYYKELEGEAVQSIERLLRRKEMKKEDYRLVILLGENAARLITQQAAKSKSSMIVMESHGRTGLRRLILGSVAGKPLRYAQCPILFVKR